MPLKMVPTLCIAYHATSFDDSLTMPNIALHFVLAFLQGHTWWINVNDVTSASYHRSYHYEAFVKVGLPQCVGVHGNGNFTGPNIVINAKRFWRTNNIYVNSEMVDFGTGHESHATTIPGNITFLQCDGQKFMIFLNWPILLHENKYFEFRNINIRL